MPQLEFANPLTISQVVWMFVIFAALYLALRNWALPQVGGVIEMRASRIAADLESARAAKEEADRSAAEVVERSRAASAQAQAEIARAVTDAKAEAAERARVDTEALDRQLDEAERRIAAGRAQAMGALQVVAAETASSLLQRLTGAEPDRGRVDAAVQAALGARS